MHRHFSIAVLIALCTAVFLSLGERIGAQAIDAGHADQRGPSTPGAAIPADIRHNMEKKANQQRQAELKRDTEKLLKLSTELKDYVDKTNENVLSLDVVKKAEEIEKLAHSVRVKMRGEQYGGGTTLP